MEGTIEAYGAGARGIRSALGSSRGRRNLAGLVLFPLLVLLVGGALWALTALL